MARGVGFVSSYYTDRLRDVASYATGGHLVNELLQAADYIDEQEAKKLVMLEKFTERVEDLVYENKMLARALDLAINRTDDLRRLLKEEPK